MMSGRWDERDAEADGSPFHYLVALEAIILGGLLLLGMGMMLSAGLRWLLDLFA